MGVGLAEQVFCFVDFVGSVDSDQDCADLGGSPEGDKPFGNVCSPHGNVVACLVGGDSATVKRFHRDHKRVLLLPENEDYEPIELSTDDFESGEARILGVAVEVKIKL